MKRPSVLILSVLSIVTAVSGGHPPFYVNHGLPAAGGEYPDVTLSYADVDIELGAETISVNASFTFVNDSPAADIAIDYPLIRREGKYVVKDDVREQLTGDFGEFAYFEEVGEGPFADIEARRALDVSGVSDDACWGEYGSSFAVGVDGEPFAFSLEERLYLYIEEGTLVAWMEDDTVVRLDVSFAEMEERTITYEYELGYELCTGKFYPELRYALYPGATWAGHIGDATISISRPPDGFERPIWFSAEYLADLGPAVFSYDGDTEVFTWEFDNYDPPEFTEINILLGIPTEDYGTFLKDLLGMYGAGAGDRAFGRTSTDKTPFVTGLSPDAEPIRERAYLPADKVFVITGSDGEWWSVRLEDATEGRIRWRYVDSVTGEEYIYAEFFAY